MDKDDLKPFKEEFMVNKVRTTLLVTLFTLVFSTASQASLLIEPFLGYSMMDVDQATTPARKGEANGLGYGARLGAQFMGLMGGFQYDSAMSAELESTNGLVTTKDDLKRTHMGVFVGYNLPIMFRFWGTYFFNSEVEGEDSENSNGGVNYIDATETLSGSGYGLGLGWTGLPFLSINLEYRKFEYDEEEDTNSTPTTSNIDPKIETSEIMISVSFPFTI
jgi:hypothetical protein